MYVSPNGYLGGAERFVLNACIGHKNFGSFHPHILFFNEGEFVEIARKQNIDFTVLKNKFKLSSPLKLFNATSEISSILKEVRPAVINSTMPYSQIVMNLAKKQDRVVSIWFQHGPVGGTLDKICARLSVDHIFFNTQYLKDLHYTTAKQKVPVFGDSILHYGIDTEPGNFEMVEQIRGHYLIDGADLLIVAAGRICEWKGYHTILKAFNRIHDRHPELLLKKKLLIIGDVKRESDRSYMHSLKELGKNLVASKFLEFVSFKENLNDYFKASNIFIHSSTIPEPFGLVVAEAMTQDTLVIGGSFGGVTEVLKNKETGLSFDAHTEDAVNQLEALLVEVLTNFHADSKYTSMIERAKSNIIDNFSIPQMISRLEGKYLELMELKTK